ncbi:MAG: glycosyltransferase family 2 protein [Leptolyngbyaceae cyanobacterium SL_5_9]|nr:glycosyltransferase family 2 protein [Leptolyngbyaceae cyanobacterium SL_5_9]
MKQTRLTLLTCTHNGERTIKQALEAIANQSDVSRDIFEVLVVDNASTDRTAEIATDTIQRLNLHGRVLFEPRIGKINAFLKGVREAQGELISIVDDDNLIEPGFIRYTLEIFDQYPDVVMTGSKNNIFVDQPLPPWFSWVGGRYGCGQPELVEEERDLEGRVIARDGKVVGAGSTFRLKPLLDCLEKGYSFFNDAQRGEKMKIAGEDTELYWLMRSLGYRFAYDPRVQIRHAIKPDRLNLQHFEAICRTIGAGSLGCDPFIFTYKYEGGRLPFQWTWQWQLVSRLKRYLKLMLSPKQFGSLDEEHKFRNWIAKVECMGAIQRILSERDKYTKHIHQVAFGKWTELRVR